MALTIPYTVANGLDADGDKVGANFTAIDTWSDEVVLKAGSTMTGALLLSGLPTVSTHAASKAYVDSYQVGSSWTPTLANMAIGTGGGAINTGIYNYVGGPSTGHYGVMSAYGRILFGTSGATLPGASAETFALPSGFNFANATGLVAIDGLCYPTDSGTQQYAGPLQIASVSTIALYVFDNAATYQRPVPLTATVPFTWVAGDYIDWAFTAPVVRV